eukprot:SM000037S13534  [mRNA]  locus=s37:582736:584148:+ [translate_table: standard]
MASPEALRRLRELQARAGNRECADCRRKSPQWASVSCGVFVCLECSGQHRALGVHISFVRSVTMDSWTPLQLRAMAGCEQLRPHRSDADQLFRRGVGSQAGGNDALREFLDLYGDNAAEGLPDIEAKYTSAAAVLYREKLQSPDQAMPALLLLQAELEGRAWRAPPPPPRPLPKAVASRGQACRSAAAATKRDTGGGAARLAIDDAWDDWGEDWGAVTATS